MTQDEKKQQVARAALAHVQQDTVVGIGTGSTVNYFIEYFAKIQHTIDGTVASSQASARILKKHRIPVVDLNSVNEVSVYIDGADEATKYLHLTKGGGGALMGEKIVSAVSHRFICIADDSKLVDMLGRFPLAVEVIPMARSYVARQIVKLGGQPVLRTGFTTDNGNVILDVHNLKITNPVELERTLDNITGVVCNGIFAQRPADLLLLGTDDGVQELR